MSRLLLLLEPHPIRNTFGAMAWVGERFLRMLLDEGTGAATADARIACNGPTLSHLAGVLPSGRPYLLGLNRADEQVFEAEMVDWHSRGRAEWNVVQNGSVIHQSRYVALLRSLRDAYPFEVLAYWGTNETLRGAAHEVGVPVLWAEFGPVRPPFETRFCLDVAGVNGSSSGRADLRLRPQDALPMLPGPSLDLEISDASAYEAALMLEPSSSAGVFSELMRFAKGRDQVVLLVGQLADDSSIKSFGCGWDSLSMVTTALELLAGPGTVFILRPHPADSMTYHNMEAGQRLRDAVAGRHDVFVVEEEGQAAYAACIAVASEVMAVNSSVCFEAMILGKPARVLGAASYMPQLEEQDSLPAPRQLECTSIKTLLSERFTPESIFWTRAFWMQKVASVTVSLSFPIMLPRLPTAVARVLGRSIASGDGILAVDGIGPLPLLYDVGVTGSFDELTRVPGTNMLSMRGWGIDPRTGGLLAGFLFTTGEHTVWAGGVVARPDVARYHGNPHAVASGFGINVSVDDMPSALRATVMAYAVFSSGFCTQLQNVWMPEASGNFRCIIGEAA